MPKKTKKQKIRAATKEKNPTTTKAPVFQTEELERRKYFFGDLKLSFLLITSIIALEILIYFVSIRR